MKQCKLFLISGRVQGVWFRASTRQQAQLLGLTGHARNMPDGRVEVLACGDKQRLSELESWLWQGPERAEVNQVSAETVEFRDLDGFITG